MRKNWHTVKDLPPSRGQGILDLLADVASGCGVMLLALAGMACALATGCLIGHFLFILTR